jgi:D-alanyl-D-alanine carboxypeptidase/D-alanyl-D-alanine-endopeptidase (penicillin-binding protein 4)
LKSFALFFALLVASAVSHAALPVPVAQALAAGGIPETAVGLYVREIGSARPVIEHAAERPMNPASTMKLVTTYAGLELLGPAYTWSTDIYATGAVQNDVLSGNLVIKGYGDPKLTLESFWMLLRNLRARGVREIRGDVILDRTHFSTDDFDPARFDGDPIRPYNTGPDALLVNFKAVTVQFVPDPETRTVRLVTEPLLDQIQVVNNVVLTDGPCGDWVARLKFDPLGTNEASRLVISGPFSRDCGERARSFSLLAHRAYVAALFSQLWKDLGGTVSGTVRDGQLVPGSRLLVSARSPALSEVIRDINKFSNNVMARQLFLTIGALGAGTPGTMEKARGVIRQWVQQKGLAIPELAMENGSGLSRTERISARGMGEMLLEAFSGPTMPEFISSMPIVAADGTMKKRLSNADVAGHAHIKGGTLNGVRAIAGYVLDARGRRVVVVLIVNHANAGNAQAAQDALLRWVYRR